MQLSKFFIFFFLPNLSILTIVNLTAVESDSAKFMAKDKENVLKIVNYQKDLEAKLRADEEERLKKQREEELKNKLKLQQKTKAQLEKERQDALKKSMLEKQLKDEQARLAKEEAKRNRLSPINLIGNMCLICLNIVELIF